MPETIGNKFFPVQYKRHCNTIQFCVDSFLFLMVRVDKLCFERECGKLSTRRAIVTVRGETFLPLLVTETETY